MNELRTAEARDLHAPDGRDHAPRSPDSASKFGAFGAAEADPFADPRFDPDDGSVPPMGDLDTDFFARGADSWAPGGDFYEPEPTPPNPRLIALKSMAARRRRAQFTKYVTAAVGVCGIVCLTAMVKVVVSRATGADDGEAPASAQAATNAETPAPSVPAAAQALAVAAPQASAAVPAAAPAPTEPAASAAPDPAASATAANNAAPAESAPGAASASPPSQEQTAPPAPAVPAMPAAPAADNAAVAANAAPANAAPANAVPTNDAPAAASAAPANTAASADSAAEAAAAREVARNELSRGHSRQSIEAGERSVALDPTDGEAWLVLGAAYQSKGAIADARRCFKACVSQAKRGPRGECSAMLR